MEKEGNEDSRGNSVTDTTERHADYFASVGRRTRKRTIRLMELKVLRHGGNSTERKEKHATNCEQPL